jgi:hypothetical protein
MTVPHRVEALTTLRAGHDRVAALTADLSEDELVRRATMGGGEWSVKDMIGHLALWEELALATIGPWLAGVRPRLAELFIDGDTDQLNAWNEEKKRSWPLARVRDDSEATHDQLLSAIERMTPEEWVCPRRFERGSEKDELASELAGILAAPDHPFGHAFAHLPDLEAYVAEIRGAADR